MMKPLLLIGLLACAAVPGLQAQNIGIGTNTPAASALLDISSTTQGLLAPVMTKAQRDAIANPANGLLITCTDCPTAGLQQYINGAWESVLQNNTESIGNYGTVVNPKTGKVWLDRNLGATRVATSSTDALAFGDLYQWGRGADGHQLRTSGTTTNLATYWSAGSGVWRGLFITTNQSPNNWLTTGETHMWSGTSAENKPCPSGFRIPTIGEWEQERLTWSSNNNAGAFNSPLKLAHASRRTPTGDIDGIWSYYWSSSISAATNNSSQALVINNSNAYVSFSLGRANGLPVRCIKD